MGVKKQANQCDGCRAGKPLNDAGNHMMGAIVKHGERTELPSIPRVTSRFDIAYTTLWESYIDLQGCTAERYDHEPGCPPDGSHCSRCGYCQFKLVGEQCLCYAR